MPGPQQIDLGTPVADHPYNRGLVSWWLGLPNRVGGFTLYDLVGHNDGALTNMGATASGWWGQHPGRFGAIGFDEFNDKVVFANSIPLTSDMTWSFWCKNTFDNGWQVGFGAIQGILLANTSVRVRFGSDFTITVPAINNAWHYFSVSCSGGTGTVYVDGRSYGTGSASGTTWTGARLGARSDDAESFGGFQGGVRAKARATGDEEQWQEYQQALKGYPDLLRRFTPASRAWYGGTALAVPNTATVWLLKA